MNLTLWLAAGLLAAVSLTGGTTKTLVPKHKLAEIKGAEWTRQASVGFIKTIGVVELLAAVGLILPAVLDIAPFMVPVTAVCWVLLMVGAVIIHTRLGQFALVLVNWAMLPSRHSSHGAVSTSSPSPARRRPER